MVSFYCLITEYFATASPMIWIESQLSELKIIGGYCGFMDTRVQIHMGGSAVEPLFFNLPVICRLEEGERVHASPLACSRLFYVFLVELARLPFLLFEL